MNTSTHSVSFSRAGYYRPATVRAYVTTLAALSATIRSEGAITIDALCDKPAFVHLGKTAVLSMIASLIAAGCVEREGSQWLLWVNPLAILDVDTSADSSVAASQSFTAVA